MATAPQASDHQDSSAGRQGRIADEAESEGKEQATLEHCVELLSGGSDERRFAGLLIAAKLLPEGASESLMRVHEACGTFLNRLLRSQDDNQRRLAATVATTLCQAEGVAGSDAMVNRCHLLSSSGVQEAVGALAAIARATGEGAEQVKDTQGVALAHDCLKQGRSEKDCLRLLASVAPRVDPMEEDDAVEAQQVRSSLGQIARVFGSNDCREAQLEGLSAMHSALGMLERSPWAGESRGGWEGGVQSGLEAVLTSKVTPELRHMALQVVFRAISVGRRERILRSERLLAAVTAALQVELTILLHEEVRAEEAGNKVRADRMGICFSLFEEAVKELAELEGEGGTEEEKGERRSSIFSSLTTTLEVVVDFIEECSERDAELPHPDRLALLAAVKALGCLLAEAPTVQQSRVRPLMPFMASLASPADSEPPVAFLLPAMAQLGHDIVWAQNFARRGPLQSALTLCLSLSEGDAKPVDESAAIASHCLECLRGACEAGEVECNSDLFAFALHVLSRLRDWAKGCLDSSCHGDDEEVAGLLRRLSTCPVERMDRSGESLARLLESALVA